MAEKPLILFLPPATQRQDFLSPEAEQRLCAFASVRFNDQERNLTAEEFVAALPGVDACITSWGSPRINAEALAHADRLRLIAHAAGSVAHIAPAAFARGIRVTHGAPVIAESVAEFTILMMLLSLRQVIAQDAAMKAGGGRENWQPGDRDLYGRTVGLVGASYVGRRVLERLRPFNVQIQVYDPYLSEAEAAALGVRKVELDDLCATSDIVSLHAPSLPSTQNMIGARQLALLRPGAVFINTARGGLVDESALIETLRDGRIRAALDVFEPEPPTVDSELRRLPNAILTPHRAGVTADTKLRLGATMVDELERFFSGAPLRCEVLPDKFARMAT